MIETAKEVIEYLLIEKSKFERQMEGIPAENYWKGYYQGKLDLIDFTLRRITDNWNEKYGGLAK